MGLLGKTLKGRSTKPGAKNVRRNVKYKQLNAMQQQYDKKMVKIRRDGLKQKILDEKKIVAINQAKLKSYWRKILRICKTEQFRNSIPIAMQSNLHELDSKTAYIIMLDKSLDESEDQYQMALRNHLIHLDHLISLQEDRMKSLREEFDMDVQTLELEFDRERQEIEENHKKQRSELDNFLDTIKEDQKAKEEKLRNKFLSFKEEIRNKDMEHMSHMRMQLESQQRRLNNELESIHQRYMTETSQQATNHETHYKQNEEQTKAIDGIARNIERYRVRIRNQKQKIKQHHFEMEKLNALLTKEYRHVSKNYQTLKKQMAAFREREHVRLKQMVVNSGNSIQKLQDLTTMGERILRTAELCRKLETEREKVLPFYESTIPAEKIPPEMRPQFDLLKEKDYNEYSYLNNFYKRYNKVLLDKLAIQKHKEALERDNSMLKSLLKQYLDGVSLNDDVLKNENPLLVVNHKLHLNSLPVKPKDGQVIIEGNTVINNYHLQRTGAPRAAKRYR